MATLEQIAEGIRRAHAAGDADNVRRLGEAYRALQAQQMNGPRVEYATQPFSELRDAGQIEQTPGDEDLWAPSVPPREPQSGTPTLPMVGDIQNNMRAFSDAVTQGATFGFADEIAAGAASPIRALITGSDIPTAFGDQLNEIRGIESDTAAEAPIASTVGNIAGAVGTGVGLARGGVSLMNGAQPTMTSMGLRGAAEGALYGGLHGFGAGETMDDRVDGAVSGALWGGGVGGALGAGAGYLANRAAVNSAPTVAELRAQAGGLYDAARDSNVVFPQSTVRQAADDIAAMAISEGLDETLHPGAAAALRRLQSAADSGMTAQQAQTLRRVISAAGKSPTNPDQGRIAGEMVRMFDDQITGSIPSLAAANQTYARAGRGQLIENAFTRARDRLGVNYNNAGMVTALRQEFNRILQNPKSMRGFSEAETHAIRDFVRGGAMENFMRHVGRLAPTGPISGATAFGVPAAAGYMLGNPAAGAAVGVGAAGTGVAARGIGNSMAMNQAQRIGAMVRGGAPLAASPARQAVVDALIAGHSAEAPRVPQNTEAMIRALLTGTSQ